MNVRSGQYVRWRGDDYRVGPLFDLNMVELLAEDTADHVAVVPFDEVSDLRQVETLADLDGHRCRVLRVLDDGRWLVAWNDDDGVDPATLGFIMDQDVGTLARVVAREELTDVGYDEQPIDIARAREQRRHAIEVQLAQWEEDSHDVDPDGDVVERVREYRAMLDDYDARRSA